ncbi:hypothetical protein TH63_03295 [Rufibacter radiotolerans]|uniref:Uncharacterized protein n=1 Tax=Rufibacter radiotolerans TaxID=1379910 RepID=A0A0H4VLS7_9BACT|nr:hypothetical protein TH63_03295 [Rufibacter radiotolerans]
MPDKQFQRRFFENRGEVGLSAKPIIPLPPSKGDEEEGRNGGYDGRNVGAIPCGCPNAVANVQGQPQGIALTKKKPMKVCTHIGFEEIILNY